jgi:hypothetical protein
MAINDHATVRIGEYLIPLITVPDHATREECDLCHDHFYIGDIDYNGIQYLCYKCRSTVNTKPKHEKDTMVRTQTD